MLLTVYNPDMKILHAQTPFNEKYMERKGDLDQDRMILRLKYYAKYAK